MAIAEQLAFSQSDAKKLMAQIAVFAPFSLNQRVRLQHEGVGPLMVMIV